MRFQYDFIILAAPGLHYIIYCFKQIFPEFLKQQKGYIHRLNFSWCDHDLQSYKIETPICVVCPYDYYYYVITLTTYSQYRSRLFRSLLSCHTKFCGKSSESKQIIRADHAQPRFNIIALKTMRQGIHSEAKTKLHNRCTFEYQFDQFVIHYITNCSYVTVVKSADYLQYLPTYLVKGWTQF